MTRLFLLISLVLGLFLSINGTLLAATRTQAALPLEWIYYITYVPSTSRYTLYRTQPQLALTQRIFQLPSTVYNITLSPDAQWLAFDALAQPPWKDLYLYDIKHHRLRNMTQTAAESETFLGWTNEYLLFSRENYATATSDIYRVQYDGQHMVNLTQRSEQTKRMPIWTSDALWLFWLEPDSRALLGKHIDSPSAQVLYTNLPSTHMSLGSDERHLYFSDYINGVRGIYRLQLDNGTIAPLHPNASNPHYLISDSPDAQWLYYLDYLASSPPTYRLYRSDIQGITPPQLIFQTQQSIEFYLSPDKAWILLEVDADKLFLVQSSDGTLQDLISGHLVHGWAANSQFILTSQNAEYYLTDTQGHSSTIDLYPSEFLYQWSFGDWLLFRFINRYVVYNLVEQALYPFHAEGNHSPYTISTRPIAEPSPFFALIPLFGLIVLMCSLIFAYKSSVGG